MSKLLVGQDIDGCWYVVRGSFGQEDYDYPGDWVADGVGTWDRAMRIACEELGGRYEC